MTARRGLGAALLVLMTAGCGGRSDGHGAITVFAAASLTDVFGALEQRFEEAHPGSDVVLNLASSSQLSAQIVGGAPADVFASADEFQMEAVVAAGLADAPRVFVTNRMALVVEAGNPLGIRGLADLADPDLVVVLAAPQVPAGRYARQILDAAGIEVAPSSEETSVRSVLTKVEIGEADAGIVYVSDVVAAGDRVAAVEIPSEINLDARYPIAVLDGAPNPEGARAFVEFVESPAAVGIYLRYGFGMP